MRCATCGETLNPGETRCPTCGTAVARFVTEQAAVRRCPRCGYRGDGVPYFRRSGHIALLVGLSVFTYGLGGLVYWFARRGRIVCPNCGFRWDRAPQALPSPSPGGGRALPAPAADPPMPRGGFARKVFGVGLIIMATALVVGGIGEAEIGLIIAGSMFGAGGSGMFWWGLKGQQNRRQAIMTGLQRKVLLLATQRGGTLTVTEVAAELNLSLPVAEKILIAMDDGFRVRSEISKEGVLYYEFPEVKHRPELGAGDTTLDELPPSTVS